MTAPAGEAAASPAFPNRNFVLFVAARVSGSFSMQIQAVAVAWQVYDIARDPLALGLVGLAQFLPMILLILPMGDLADRFDKSRLIAASYGIQALAAAGFLALTLGKVEVLWPYYSLLVLFGVARALAGPAQQAFVASLVPAQNLPAAIAWSSTAFQTAVIGGPALGGLLYLLGPVVVYGGCLVLFLGVVLLSLAIDARFVRAAPDGSTAVQRLRQGIAYVRSKPIVLGAISLDLFAVLLGGATAMLPVYARDILVAGPFGLGLLRSAPAIGAVLTGLVLTRFAFNRRAGAVMFACVAIFGVSTIAFGLSTDIVLSIAALIVLGASDMVSMYVRGTLVQVATPPDMRGRVSAVNMMFIGASNELGEFESGLMAGWLGAVPSVVVGGIGTLVVTAAWMGLFPALRKVDRLTDLPPGA